MKVCNEREKILIRSIDISESHRIREIDASQYIGRAWRDTNDSSIGERELVVIDYQDHDFPNGYEHHLSALNNTIKTNGIAVGAFNSSGDMIGFCAVNTDKFGSDNSYVLLDQLFISLAYRGKGIGKALFIYSANEAKKCGAKKFYICAGSAEETVAFYFKIGCRYAEEINEVLYANDKRDLQLEYSFY